jgi:hypothetical protein
VVLVSEASNVAELRAGEARVAVAGDECFAVRDIEAEAVHQ